MTNVQIIIDEGTTNSRMSGDCMSFPKCDIDMQLTGNADSVCAEQRHVLVH